MELAAASVSGNLSSTSRSQQPSHRYRKEVIRRYDGCKRISLYALKDPTKPYLEYWTAIITIMDGVHLQ